MQANLSSQEKNYAIRRCIPQWAKGKDVGTLSTSGPLTLNRPVQLYSEPLPHQQLDLCNQTEKVFFAERRIWNTVT